MKQRIVIITGAGSGIGKATAISLAERKYKMILTGRDPHKLREVANIVDEIANEKISLIVTGDIANATVTEACIKAGQVAWGSLPSAFIACAGRGLPGTLTTSDAMQWDDLINTNIKGLLHQLRAITNAMIEQLSENYDYIQNPLDIVVIGSSIGRNVSPFNPVYGSTKFAAHGITEALRRDIGPKGIRVSLIEPGIVSTSFQQTGGYNMEWFSGYEKEIGPVLIARDVAEVIGFLLSLPGNVNLDNISIRPTRQAYP
ncbi:SDR family oxidoreductase [Pedobacter alluvionis]|uniref:NADP-dependent 3-hydroxy acid dehydrogenase YdfG n=1 Tax=Pedobacter alluvionis TaxID=475253 RepID=A0A497XTH3_9SPHI|nr:SDR family oxidoreductase [Pedobacter alluvionis]RLJ72730.1 NADP-dependent 3-hydroxy acid dehydrogenase YdfG [Pedobacter alluvionis]TFB29430.1 SDR family oxidoreductase [Pedobacter alluvionis]